VPVLKRKSDFFLTEEGLGIANELQQMATSPLYMTDDSYSADSDKYPNNLRPFVDKHMHYLNTHPSLDAQHYLSNLRLMTRKR